MPKDDRSLTAAERAVARALALALVNELSRDESDPTKAVGAIGVAEPALTPGGDAASQRDTTPRTPPD